MSSHPYSDVGFFGFFFQLLLRLWGLLTGNIGVVDLATDEVQIIVLVCVAASSALVGSFLVLKKMTMLANSLSHTILLGLVVAFLITQNVGTHSLNINVLLIAALIMGLVTAFLTDFFCKVAKLQEDASTGIVFTSLFALGIVLVTMLTRNVHLSTEVVMGNVDALHLEDCQLVLIVLAFNIIVTTLFFKEFKITTFDPSLSKALGISVICFNYLMMIQVSATVVGAFRAVGVLMVLAFMTGPVLTARMLTHDLKRMILLAIAFGCSAAIIGVALSRHLLTYHGLALSTAGLVVCTIALQFIFVLILNLQSGLLRKRHSITTQEATFSLERL